MPTILSCKGIGKVYLPNNSHVAALYNINLALEEGEMYLIHGKSGSGKSTLINIMAGLDTPTYGSVKYWDREYSKMTEGELAKIRGNDFGFVYQNYNLFENLDAYENVILPLKINGHTIDKETVYQLMFEMGLEKMLKKKVYKMSGGEQQRVAIARAMVMKPTVLFADEPTGNLDSENTAMVSELFYKINKEHNTTLVVVSHDDFFMKKNSHLIVLKDGKLEDV